MMRIHINRDAGGLVAYFGSSLSKDDYFFGEGRNVQGHWHGKLTGEFGLGNRVHKKDFRALAHNVHPRTGERLGIRETENRRCSIEYMFSAPKSVSVVMALTGDRGILNAHRLAVKRAMEAIEADMHTQVRVEGRNTYQRTGNLLYARFDHFTSRPVREEGSSLAKYSADPLLHSHCVVPNTTLHEGRLRALEGSVVHSVAPYYEAIYHGHLSRSLAGMGYGIVRTKDRYEIKGISRQVIEKFSGRTAEIERLAKKLGITGAREKAGLGAKTRLHKSRLEKDADLQAVWRSRLTPKELAAIQGAKGEGPAIQKGMTAEQAVERALEHCLERNSTVPVKRLLAQAMTLGYGTLAPADVERALASRSDILTARQGHLEHLTTKGMVRAEDRMVAFAAGGKNTLPPISPGYRASREYLNAQQAAAVAHILRSKDRVCILSGAAGSGKSTLLMKVREAAGEAGRRIVAVAPSSGASRGVLREKGFKGADTIARFLRDGKLRERARGQVILVDEASLIGVRTMNRLFGAAEKLDARLVLCGDTNQHNSPEAGDALRLLQQKAGLKVARVGENLRQRGNPGYRKAIDHLAAGRARMGFAQLEKMGAVVEAGDAESRHRQLAADYVRSLESRRSAIVISPTHAEGRLITAAIREELKSRGRIHRKERPFTVYRNLSYTESQKKDLAMFGPGMAVRFHQNHRGGYVAGDRYEVVTGPEKGDVHILSKEGKRMVLPTSAHRHYQVYRKEGLQLAEGDRIRVTHNGRSVEGGRLHNGQVLGVRGFTRGGNIRLSNGKTLDKGFGHFTYGHVQTSHAAQGKDCRDVYIAQSAMSFGASNDKQFYVSASRARETVTIYTDDKKALRDAVARSGERTSAGDIARAHRLRQRQRYYGLITKNGKGHGRETRPVEKGLLGPHMDKA